MQSLYFLSNLHNKNYILNNSYYIHSRGSLCFRGGPRIYGLGGTKTGGSKFVVTVRIYLHIQYMGCHAPIVNISYATNYKEQVVVYARATLGLP